MKKNVYEPAPNGIPGLILVPTGETVVINGKRYRLLEVMYDLKGKYLPLATMRPA